MNKTQALRLYSLCIVIMLLISPISSLLPWNQILIPVKGEDILIPTNTITDTNPENNLGWNVSWAGDINGDGFDDIIAGAPYAYSGISGGRWWDSNWTYRRKLAFNNTQQAEDLIYFPVLVNLTLSNFNYSKANLDGSDIRFIDTDSKTQLNYHIEEWNPLGNTYIWVNVTQIDRSSSSDFIWMYYGNPAASHNQDITETYDINYIGVWHLNETSGIHYDATSNNNNGTPQGGVTQNTVGNIDGADSFDGAGDYINFGTTDTLNITSGITIEAWVKPVNIDHVAPDLSIVGKFADTQRSYALYLDDDPGDADDWNFRLSSDGVSSDGSLHASNEVDINKWQYMVGTWNGTDMILYKNGVQIESTLSFTGLIFTSSIELWIGDGTYYGSHEGFIDEVRISDKARSADWIAAQYLSMGNNFITYDPEEINTWWNSSWQYRKKLTFDNSGQPEDLVNFPVLVKLNPVNFDYLNAKTDGTDLRFVDNDGATLLNYHIESWSASQGSFIWVKVPRIDAGSSIDFIWMYYGNSTASNVQDVSGTFNSDYLGVWHLNETSGTHFDATSNNFNGVPFGGLDQDEIGAIDGADLFDGLDDYIQIDPLSLDNYTISMWVSGDGTIIGYENVSMKTTWDLQSENPDSTIYGERGEDQSGTYVSSGDINGDGINDTVIGSMGSVFIIYGDALRPDPDSVDLNSQSANLTIRGDAHARFGTKVATGDLNNDGFDDVIIGSIYKDYAGRNDCGAVYVIYGYDYAPGTTIDLTVSSANITIYGETNSDNLGRSVATGDINYDGIDDVIVSASAANPGGRSGAGSIYVLYGDNYASGMTLDLNSQPANLTIHGNEFGDSAGIDVASGDFNDDGFDDIIIGASGADPVGGNGAGEVYVIYGLDYASGTVIDLNSDSANITIYGDDVDDNLGRAVASGDINNDGFDDVILGVYQADPSSGIRAGEAYVIYGANYASGTELDLNSTFSKLTIYGDDAYDYLGFSVSSGDINNDGFDDVILGAWGTNPPGGTDAGTTYVIYGASYASTTIIDLNSTSANLTINGDDASDLSGYSVSSGDMNDDGIMDVIIGAYAADPPGGMSAGETYVIYGADYASGSIIDLDSESANIMIQGDNGTDKFGRAISSGDVNGDGYYDLIIGAYTAVTPGGSDAGKTYVFFGKSDFTPTIDLVVDFADITIYGNDSGDYSGYAVSSGDINSDGFDDVIIGAYGADAPGGIGAGEAIVIYGGNYASGTIFDLNSSPADITIYGDDFGDNFGRAVDSGDINNDGFDDVIVGSTWADSPSGSNEGAAYVIYGGNYAPGTIIDLNMVSANLTVYGENSTDYCGLALSSGDVNYDGFDDLIIGAYEADPFGVDGAGETYVIYGSDFVPGSIIDLSFESANLTIYGNGIDSYSGLAVASGDINNDGYSDVIIGAYQADPAGRNEAGEVYVIYGGNYAPGSSIDLSSESANLTILGDDANDRLGRAVATEDVNNDGISDLILGAYMAETIGGSQNGETYVIYGLDYPSGKVIDLSLQSANLTIFGIDSVDRMGSSVHAKDINGDGFAEIIAGAYEADFKNRFNSGEVYIINPLATAEIIKVETIDSRIRTVFAPDRNTSSVISPVLNTGIWHLITVSKGDSLNLYIDGVLIGSANVDGNSIGNALDLTLGVLNQNGTLRNYFGGIIDEVKISKSARSQDWISAQYLSESDNFISFSIEEDREADSGNAFLFFGYLGFTQNNIFTSNADVAIYGENPEDQFGMSVSGAGDINSDGFDDVIIGAPGWSNDTGRAYIFHGRSAWNQSYTASEADVILTGENQGDRFGSSLSGMETTTNQANTYRDWLYRKKITISSSQVAEDLVDFPVLLNITDPDLKTKARSDGNDIFFTKLDGSSRLNHEVEQYNGSSGELIAWVRIPSLSSSADSVIYMYYGNSNQVTPMENPRYVWDSNYSAVWHLNDDLLDSTIYNRDGTNFGSEDKNSIIAKGQNFEYDDTTDHIDLGTWNVPGQGLTLQAWVKFESFDAEDGRIISKGDNEGENEHIWMLSTKWVDSEYRLRMRVKTGSALTLEATSGAMSPGIWYFVMGTYDGAQVRLRLDKSEVGNMAKTGNMVENSDSIYIGNHPFPTDKPLDGMIDEVRVSSIKRSDAWLDTEYNNLINSSLFHSIGQEEINVANWKYRKPITIDSTKVTSDLTDFPVLINHTDSDLISKARGDGYDIVFTESDGSTKLDHEIESYNGISGELIAWVRIPNLSSISDTIIYMYYGSSDGSDKQDIEGVWRNGYVGVYHMVEETGDINNSASSTNNGSRQDSPTRTTGRIGYGQVFSGSAGNDRFNLGDMGLTNGVLENLTLSFWMYADDALLDNWGRVIIKRNETDNSSLWGAYFDDDVTDKDLFFRAANDVGANTIGKSVWVYVSLTYDGSIKIHYHNGSQVRTDTGGSGPISATISSAPVTIGARLGGSQEFGGILDEVRISKITHSAGWISTEYNNQNNSGAFSSIGAEELISTNETKSIIIGAYGYDNNRGRAYVFSGESGLLGEIPASSANVIINGSSQGNLFGWDVSFANDVNNDGLWDIIVGAPGNNSLSGAAYVFNSIDSLPSYLDSSNADLILNGKAPGDRFGFSVSSAGDLNNDGFSDVIVGAPFTDNTGIDIGSVYIYFGNSTLDNLIDVGLKGVNNGDGFGFSVASSGDFDGDGISDVIVGAPYYDAGPISDAGAIFVFSGGPAMDNLPDWICAGTQTYEHFGWSVSSSQNLDNSSLSYIIVGAPNNNEGGLNAGKIYILEGLTAKISVTNILTLPATQLINNFVNITCDVSAINGVNSVWVNISLPGGGFINGSMVPGSGNQFYYYDNYSKPGIYQYSIWANDLLGNSTSSTGWQFEMLSANPLLSLEQVNPNSGLINTDFNFTVQYTHPSDLPPDTFTINITGPSHAGSWNMLEVDSGDTDYTDGKSYYYNYTGFITGSYSFNFAANDTFGNWEESTVLPFDVLDSAPLLSLGQVTPITGYTSYGFNFTLQYTHPSDLPPDIFTVNITGPSHSGSWDMLEVDSGDTDYTDGKMYYYNYTGFSIGSYSFNFGANDSNGIWDESVSLPFDVLDESPTLSSQQVDPTSGYINTDFNFTMIYTSPLDLSPSNITVNISGIGVYDLVEVDPLDIDHTDGKVYYLNDSGFSVGNHPFNFAARDTNGNWVEGGTLFFDVLNSTPSLSLEQINPTTGYEITDFNFTVAYTSPNNLAPDNMLVNITGWGNYALNPNDPLDLDYTDGNEFYLNISGFTFGSYPFHFAANDTNGIWVETGSSSFDILSSALSLTLPSVNPTIGYVDTSFNFTINYASPANLPPVNLTVIISSFGTFDLMQVDPLDTDYTDGKDYYLNISGFTIRTYSYRFEANDSIGNSVVSVTNQFNILNRPPTFSSPSVAPNSGNISSGFNFSVIYEDLDNQAPDKITVNITGYGFYDLIEFDPLDTDYSGGKEYYYNATGFTVGSFTFHFAANDSFGVWVETGLLGFNVINRAPSLSASQVNPGLGYLNSDFNFTVIYTDLDNHAPGRITVNISGLGVYDLMEFDLFDLNYFDGKLFYLNSSGFSLGSYTFHFAANDSVGSWVETTNLVFDIVNRPPALAIPQVNPILGYLDSNFNFTVIYTDLDDQAPGKITVNISGLGVYDFLELDPLDLDFADGKGYYLDTTGFALGSYTFHFAANDSIGYWVESGNFGFDVVNRLPTLSIPQVNPTLGYLVSNFNFTVIYTDLDDQAPGKIAVNISGLGVYDLLELDPLDLDFSDGKAYYLNTSGFTLGSYTFHFAANDSIGFWVESGIFGFDVINRAPTLSLPQVDPLIGYLDLDFNFTVTYTDLDNQAPSNILVNITGLGTISMLESDFLDNDFTDGKSYYYNTSGIPLGLYSFNFAANDPPGDWVESNILQFDVINRVPTLSFGGVDPLTNYFNSWFNFTVIYLDPDGDPPNSVVVNISGFGSYVLYEVDPFDIDFSDGKVYYYNVSDLPVGSHSFHFAANDSGGLWANETPEISGLDVLPIDGSIAIVDLSLEFSDDFQISATLKDNNDQAIVGEYVSFFIDFNQNGMYESFELAGSVQTDLNGNVFINHTEDIIPGLWNFTARYNGSINYLVTDGEAEITINPKPASLLAVSNDVEAGELVDLTAILIDFDSNQIENGLVAFYIDFKQDDIFEVSELISTTYTSSEGVAEISYLVNLAPGDYGFRAKYIGSGNYSVNEIDGLLSVYNSTDGPPMILFPVPHQTKTEDSPPWTLDLTEYEDDLEDLGSGLNWYLTGVDTSLYTVTGMNSSNDEFTFIPQKDAFGNDLTTLWLVDSSGNFVSQTLWINITPLNDAPFFNPLPPNLYVHFDDPTTPEDDPSPFDYTFYVHDTETSISNLILTTSEPPVDRGQGYAKVNGLSVTFHYPESKVGESILVTLIISDGTDFASTAILVNVTMDWVPKLIAKLPNVVLKENSTVYNAFDLDDYFTDKDHNSLFYSSGFVYIQVTINENNTVDIKSSGEWTGEEYVTFRAMDPVGAIVEDTIKVTVIPVNDGPSISGVPDLVVHYDYSYAFDLSPYIKDSDNHTFDLQISSSELSDYIWVSSGNNLGIVINYPELFNGMTIPVTFYVTDGYEWNSQEIQISVTDDFPPELISKLPDVFFSEDAQIIGAFSLSDYFFDFDGDVLFYTNGTQVINVTINPDLSVDFSAPLNWYGSERITFRATDPFGAIAEDSVLVVVIPVNDAPTIDNIPKQDRDGSDEWTLDISQFIRDVDNDMSELIISVSGDFGTSYVKIVGNILIFQYPGDIYEDIVTITVSDGELETTKSFIVTIQRPEPKIPMIWDMIPWVWVFAFTIIALLSLFLFFRRHNKFWVYEVFLIHDKGLPLAHASQKETSELEEVVVSGMFTAVQDFINDAFMGKTDDDEWELDEMKFGENKILIERQENLFLAVVFGGNGDKLRLRVKRLLAEINSEFSSVLNDWDGDMSKLKGLRAMTMKLLSSKKPGKQGKKKKIEPEPQIEKKEEIPVSTPTIQDQDLTTESVELLEGAITEAEALVHDSEIHAELHMVAEMSKGPGTIKIITGEIEHQDCPVCGADYISSESSCNICGTEFGKLKQMFDELQVEIPKCPSCSTVLEKGANLCAVCGYDSRGTKKKVAVFECPECGDNVKENARFCSQCGVEFIE